MKVLIGCECSGEIRRAFRDRGHDAYSIDLVQSEDRSPFHIVGNILEKLWYWDLIIAHPPCKYLSASGMHWTTRGKRPAKMTEIALELVRQIMNAPCEHIAIENPVGAISTRLTFVNGQWEIVSKGAGHCPAAQYVQPYQFGDDASKNTGLWLKNLPKLVPTKYVKPRLICNECGGRNKYEAAFQKGCVHCGAGANELKPRWANQTDSGQNRLGPSETRSADRARTYPGIAAAMAEQWGKLPEHPCANGPTPATQPRILETH